MQRYVSIMYEENLDKIAKKHKRRIINKLNSSFEGCAGNKSVCSALIAFLMSCAMHQHRNPNANISDKMFYPSLVNVDLYELWDKIGRNLIHGLGSIDDYINKKGRMNFSDSSDNLVFYMDDYCSYMIESRLYNDGNEAFLNINDEEIVFFCKMCIGEFLDQLELIDSGKSNICIGVNKRMDEILEDNANLEEKITELEDNNNKLKIELNRYASKKEKIVYVEDKSRISELNKEIKNKDTYIAELEKKIEELSYIKEVSDRTNTGESSENEIDFDKKFVFVGGCFNTVKQLRDLFHNAYFYDNETGIDKFVVTSDDVIVVYLTDFMSHSIYYKVRNMCEKTKQIHCPSSNIVRVLETISANMG